MPSRFRKSRKQRGSRTCGWGQVGQHRMSGGRGGKGNAGLLKHKWTWTIKYDPNHFGKDSLSPKKTSKIKKWFNVGDLDGLVGFSKTKSKKDEGKKLIDLDQLGYGKLLGNGRVNGSYTVKIKFYTEKAKLKIEKAGGEIVAG